MREWDKFRVLTPSQRWTFVQALIALPTLAAGLRLLGVRRCRAMLDSFSFSNRNRGGQRDDGGETGEDDADLETADGIARLVSIAATRGIRTATCLERSLILDWLLRRRGIPSEVRYGGRFEDRQWTAHAWVESHGHVVGDRPDISQRFTPFEAPLPRLCSKDVDG